MAELRIPRAHSNDWYDSLAGVQEGYYLPWKSKIGSRNGEEAFHQLLTDLVTDDMSVLEVGCGHGDLALALAGRVEKIISYDRVRSYIELAERRRSDSSISNVSFLCYDATDPALPELRLPVEDGSVDMIICRRGPHHWIQDAKRVCKPGAKLLQLSPMEEPIPAWSDKLPHVMHYENSGRYTGSGSIHHSVDNRLHQAGLTLHSGWGFDVPEVFETKRELYRMVTWGLPSAKTPSFDDVDARLQMIFDTYAEPGGIVLRHCRYLWYAEVPG